MKKQEVNRQRFNIVSISSGEADVRILYPLFPTEFDVQRTLYDALMRVCEEVDNHLQIKSEITAFCDEAPSRFDLMVFKEDVPLCAIEVKRFSKPCPTPHGTRQKIKYHIFSRVSKIPVLHCNGIEDIDAVAAKVREIVW